MRRMQKEVKGDEGRGSENCRSSQVRNLATPHCHESFRVTRCSRLAGSSRSRPMNLTTWIPRLILAALLSVLALYAWPEPPRPTSFEIRLDTGDIRYFHDGELLSEEQMEEPFRSALLSAATESNAMKPDWHRGGRPPGRSSRMCRRYYRSAAVWLMKDREIGLLVANDVTRWIKETNATFSAPDAFPLISWVKSHPDGSIGVVDYWRKDEQAQLYLSRNDIDISEH